MCSFCKLWLLSFFWVGLLLLSMACPIFHSFRSLWICEHSLDTVIYLAMNPSYTSVIWSRFVLSRISWATLLKTLLRWSYAIYIYCSTKLGTLVRQADKVNLAWFVCEKPMLELVNCCIPIQAVTHILFNTLLREIVHRVFYYISTFFAFCSLNFLSLTFGRSH